MEGYIRSEDSDTPQFGTAEEQIAWQENQPPFRFIPLYDFQGNEIGKFRLDSGVVHYPAGTTLEQAKAMVAAGEYLENEET